MTGLDTSRLQRKPRFRIDDPLRRRGVPQIHASSCCWTGGDSRTASAVVNISLSCLTPSHFKATSC